MSELRFKATYSARHLAADFTVSAGEVLAVTGPNGAGKSTILALIAGLLRPDSGSIQLGPLTLCDCTTKQFVPPARRGVALLQQDALLFPHMSVAANVEFGLRLRGARRSASRAAAERWLSAVGCADLADRKPQQLSGGQAQRVAIARALATEPELILLDEPLAGLDAGSAPALRELLAQVLGKQGRGAVIVTHDLMDAVTLADRVMVLDAGQIRESGATQTVLTRPASDFGARFAGVNLVRGTIATDGALYSPGVALYGTTELTAGAAAVAVFSPRTVSVHRERPGGSPRNVIEVSITNLAAHADSVAVTATAGETILTAHITTAAATELKLVPGMSAYLVVEAHEVVIQPS